MNKLKKKLSSYKIIIVLVFVLIFFLNFSYAEDVCNTTLNTTSNLITQLLWIASWIWIILSRVAWTLMTNSVIYGSFMNLDTFLWKMWQMCRTFANFALWFMFLISIFKYIIFPTSRWTTPIKMIKEILVASVLVQLSWFLVMIVIDLSTIAISAVASFPAQIIESSESIQTPMVQQLGKSELVAVPLWKQRCVVYNALWGSFADDKDENWVTEKDCTIIPDFMKHLVDNVTPNPKNLSWPFMYLWLTVFKTKAVINKVPQTNTDCVEKFTRIFINIFFDALLTILFSLALLILVIILLFRLMYIRLFIIISPLIVLFSTTSLKKYIWQGNSIFSSLNIWSVLKLIFQPVIFALYISLMLLVIITFQAFMLDGTPKGPWLAFDESKMSDGTFTTQLDIWGNVKSLVQQWTRSVWEIFLSLLALAMMWYLVKLAVSTKTWIKGVDSTIENMSKLYTGLATDMPIIPTKWWWISLNSVWNEWNVGDSDVANALKKTKLGSKLESYLDFKTQRDREINDLLSNFWFWKIMWLSNPQKRILDLSARENVKFSDFRSDLMGIKEKNWWLQWNDVKGYVAKWIENNKNKGEIFNVKELFGENSSDNVIKAGPVTRDKLWEITNADWWKYFYKHVLDWKGSVRSYADLEKSQQIR